MKYTLFVLALLMSSNSWSQDILINKVSTDIRSVSQNDIKERFLSTLDTRYSLYYVELDLAELEETKMAGIDSKVVLLSEFTIKLYSLLDESLVAVNSLKLTASGRNIAKARKNSLRALKKQRRKINSFLKENTQAVVDCAKIESAVNAYINTENYAKAYALTSSPSEACPEQMWTLKQKVYDRYQEEYCDDHLIKVKAFISIKEYKKATQEIINISPDSRCRSELMPIIQSLKDSYQADYDDDYNAYLKYLEVESKEQKDRKELINLLLIKRIIHD